MQAYTAFGTKVVDEERLNAHCKVLRLRSFVYSQKMHSFYCTETYG